ncbi:MAG: peptide-methionine (S)-S-oxide reductase MsrA [Desertimonas sp.]
MLFRTKSEMVSEADALPGRTDQTMPIPEAHHVNGRPLVGPWPDGMETAVFGLGCFWGAEEVFWQVPGVYSTAVGYAGGFTPNPTYEEVCSGRTGHTEAVVVVFDPEIVSFEALLKVFWAIHDPTQGLRQGNDIGSQYRSAVYLTDDTQRAAVDTTRDRYAAALAGAGRGEITTEVAPLGDFYYAEPYHQQYLAKNPHGYRCHAATGVPYPG